jgi:hypothetical protein
VELRGFEPLTFCMPCSMVSSDDVVLGPGAAVQSNFNVRGRLARSGEIWGRWYLVWSWFCRTSRSVKVLGAQGTLEDGEQGGVLVASPVRVPSLPGSANKIVAGGEGVGVLGMQKSKFRQLCHW